MLRIKTHRKGNPKKGRIPEHVMPGTHSLERILRKIQRIDNVQPMQKKFSQGDFYYKGQKGGVRGIMSRFIRDYFRYGYEKATQKSFYGAGGRLWLGNQILDELGEPLVTEEFLAR